MADIVVALNKHHFDELCKWLNAMVQQDGFPSARATRQEKEQFTRQLLKLVITLVFFLKIVMC